MIKRFSQLVLFSAGVGIIAFSAQASAGVVGFKPGRIIDDMIFTNSTSMSVGDIQNFLNSKVPVCDTWGKQMYNSWQTRAQFAATIGQYPPFTCLKDFSENGKTAAQIIYDTSKAYSINPQVLIVLLQKEQALVTGSWPYALQYQRAAGYRCPDTAPCDSLYHGFSNQIKQAANMFHQIMIASPYWYTPYILGNNFIRYSPTVSCGGSNVYIENRATQALYNYTPYQPNQASLDVGWGSTSSCGAYGNRNFYLYFTSWFGVTTGTPLVQAPSSNTVYLLSNNKRFAIPSGDILYAYGLRSVPITAVSNSFVASVPDGGILSTIFTLPGDSTVYMADLGRKIAIASGTYCDRWGLPCGDPTYQHELGAEFRNGMGDGGMLQPVMKFAGKYYLMENGKKLHFTSTQALQENGYSDASSTLVGNWTNATREFGIVMPANNTFIKFKSSPSIYLYSNSGFYGFSSYESFLGWSGPSITTVLEGESSYNITPPTLAGTLLPLVKSADGTISLLTYSKRYILTGAAVADPRQITNTSTLPSINTLLQARPAQTVTAQNAIALPSGTIAKLEGSVLRPIPTLGNLNLEFAPKDIVSLSNEALKVYSIGKLSIPPGQIIKPGTSAMYIYASDHNIWALSSLSEFWATNSWLNTGAISVGYDETDMIGIKVYSGLVSFADKSYIVTSDGMLHEIASNSVGKKDSIMPLSGPVASRLKYSVAPASFIRFDNGTIFNIQTDAIHPLASMSAYYRQGGNGANTVSLPIKDLSVFTVGSVTY